jgi:hypothetical protein
MKTESVQVENIEYEIGKKSYQNIVSVLEYHIEHLERLYKALFPIRKVNQTRIISTTEKIQHASLSSDKQQIRQNIVQDLYDSSRDKLTENFYILTEDIMLNFINKNSRNINIYTELFQTLVSLSNSILLSMYTIGIKYHLNEEDDRIRLNKAKRLDDITKGIDPKSKLGTIITLKNPTNPVIIDRREAIKMFNFQKYYMDVMMIFTRKGKVDGLSNTSFEEIKLRAQSNSLVGINEMYYIFINRMQNTEDMNLNELQKLTEFINILSLAEHVDFDMQKINI